jgi:hypothetical protein
MIQTEGAILNGIFKYIKGSELAASISGEVYKSIDRPVNSDKEDIVIKSLANLPRQRQRTKVNVNIWVPDFQEDGQYHKDGSRCDELEEVAARVLEVFRVDDARVCIDTSDNSAFHTYKVEEAHSHVINIKLLYEHINEN